ncbi:MAG: radical SAM protein [Nitrospirae bacterium]|nr:radical SAM protein [Nitrospirota bacterium]MBF0519235.1 radical SAM protein [Nitrospirota bacterium]MBF0535767.1 radical SAM protein [Nitrospirota bacterium]MBF0617692.1 radical SAM protein [Nitrospirota bacterium]
MRILAVHPIYRANQTIVYIPLGLSIMCAVAEQHGHEVEVLDMHNLKIPYSVLENKLRNNEYQVCIMGGFSLQVSEMKVVTQIIQKIQPNCKVIVGGVGVASMPEIIINYTRVDAVSVGEAELTFPPLLQAIADGKPYYDIAGFSYRVNNSLIHQPRGPIPQNLDEIPWPAYHLFDIDYISLRSYNGIPNGRSIHLMTSRGCPFRCDFCINSILNNSALSREIHGDKAGPSKAQRFRSIPSLITEIQHIQSTYGINDFHFTDEEFITHRKRLQEVCDAFESLGITWSTSGRADWATDDKLAAMKRSGCHYILFGVETGSQKMMDMMDKKAKKEAVVAGIQSARKVGLSFILNFMIGYPGETKETIEETIAFCKENRLLYAPSFVTLFPYSKMFLRFSKNITDWENYFERLSRIDDTRGLFYNLTEFTDKKLFALRNHAVATTMASYVFPNAPKLLNPILTWCFRAGLALMDIMPSTTRKIIRDFIRYHLDLKKSFSGRKIRSRQILPHDVERKLPKDTMPDSYEKSVLELIEKKTVKLPAEEQRDIENE